MTTFYPFRPLCCREPDSMFAMRRTEKHLGGQPHLIGGATCGTRPLCRAARTRSDQTMATWRPQRHLTLQLYLSNRRVHLQLGSLWQDARFQKTPEGDQQLSR